jgi:hypothetical protein
MKASNQKEIPRNPETPALSKEAVRLLTELCFKQDDDLEKVDLIFIFSSSVYCEQIADIVHDLLDKGISNKVLVTGGFTEKNNSLKYNKSECELVMKEIDVTKYPEVEFIKEEKSTNTFENVAEALKVLDFRNYNKVLFIFKSHAAGRGYLTLRKFLPKSRLLQKSYDAGYLEAEHEIGRSNWYTFDYTKSRVWGEFLRIKKYGQRGDIEFKEVKELVDKIDKLAH